MSLPLGPILTISVCILRILCWTDHHSYSLGRREPLLVHYMQLLSLSQASGLVGFWGRDGLLDYRVQCADVGTACL